MALYVLDTDTFTLFREGHYEVNRRVQAHPPAKLATSVITVEEQLTGWYSLVRRARTPEQLEMAYRELAESVQLCSQVQILLYTQAAISRFEDCGRFGSTSGQWICASQPSSSRREQRS